MADRRIKYTKMVLKESLLKLMSHKEINKITIREICDLADVNRGTFYVHYKDQYDLFKQIQDELEAEIMELFNKRQSKKISKSDMITELITYFIEHRSLCRIIFGAEGNNEFIYRLLLNAYEVSINEWKTKLKGVNEHQLDMLYTFTLNGAASIIQKCVLCDIQMTPGEIAKFMQQVTNYGISAFS